MELQNNSTWHITLCHHLSNRNKAKAEVATTRCEHFLYDFWWLWFSHHCGGVASSSLQGCFSSLRFAEIHSCGSLAWTLDKSLIFLLLFFRSHSVVDLLLLSLGQALTVTQSSSHLTLDYFGIKRKKFMIDLLCKILSSCGWKTSPNHLCWQLVWGLCAHVCLSSSLNIVLCIIAKYLHAGLLWEVLTLAGDH